jgi:hypothetical protein
MINIQMFFILLKSYQNINIESDLAFSILTYELTIMVKKKHYETNNGRLVFPINYQFDS